VCLSNRDRATGKALCEGLGSLPTLLAPVSAAAIISWLGGVSAGGIRTLYWLYFAAAVVPTIYTFRNLPEIERVRENAGTIAVFSEFREVFERGTALKRYLIFMTVNTFTRMMLFTFIYPYSFEIGSATPFILGGISTAMTLAEVLFSTVFGRLADHIGRKKAYYILVPFFGISNLLFYLVPSGWYLIAAGFFFGFRMIAGVVHSSMAPELVPSDCIGRWRGIIGLLAGLATMFASIAGGYIWEQLGAQHLFTVAAAIDLLIAVPLLSQIPETLQEDEEPDKKTS
jgi:MFS family permease